MPGYCVTCMLILSDLCARTFRSFWTPTTFLSFTICKRKVEPESTLKRNIKPGCKNFCRYVQRRLATVNVSPLHIWDKRNYVVNNELKKLSFYQHEHSLFPDCILSYHFLCIHLTCMPPESAPSSPVELSPSFVSSARYLESSVP